MSIIHGNIEWDYRVILEEDGTYRIIEVYYDEDGKTIQGWTFPDPVGDSLGETLQTCYEFQACVERVLSGHDELVTLADLPDAEEEDFQIDYPTDEAFNLVRFN